MTEQDVPRNELDESLDLLAEDKAGAKSPEANDRDAELTEARNQVLRAQAELENFRKRVRREMESERKYAHLPLIADLLGSLDNLQRAVDSAEPSQTGSGLLEGVKMVIQQINGVLEKHHCKPIVALDVPFDPHLHEAIAQEPKADVPPGTVTNVVGTGYQLHDRVVRPAQVMVSVTLPNEANRPPVPDDES